MAGISAYSAREYPGYCRWAKQYWDGGFRRWTCLLRWDVLSDDLLTASALVPIVTPVNFTWLREREMLKSRQIRYRPRDTLDLDLQLKARKATIAAPVGPLRLTWVLGATQAASDGGQCALSTAVTCTSNSCGSARKCQ